MPKTWGLTYKTDSGKLFHGVAADNHFVYDKCHGLPAYTLIVVSGTLFLTSAALAGYNKIIQYCRVKTNTKNDEYPSNEDSTPK